jgi:DNA invertase Pin-like site-specific DNA recombinase
MAANAIKPVRCAIYTRKSTEHGLELEFNSLDAQRDACDAYIKSQASQGWRALPEHYDDPAFSGGNLDRPALQRLLRDIDAGRIDVIVVYKIDRLTRSLADFAKLVEAFDAKSISFVAVTQQFNTTTSMGRLTLNVLLSFAQFERELSSERVRDKVAASRRKGKWTGGTVPLGYDATDKKLVINKVEAETVRYIFKRYLELRSFGNLVEDLDDKGIVTKRRNTKVKKFNGAIPFTYGPLAHFLKNRLYIGETGHKEKWFPGEHAAIVDRKTFDQVQQLLASKSAGRKVHRTASEALLMGKLYDDRGNRMSPSFSTNNGVRYRFYVSSALLRGRKAEAGSVGRLAAQPIEDAVVQAVRNHLPTDEPIDDAQLLDRHLSRIELGKNELIVSLKPPEQNHIDERNGDPILRIRLPWSPASSTQPSSFNPNPLNYREEPDLKAVQAIARARHWASELTNGTFASVDELAASAKLNSKVLRNELRLAFLAPGIVDDILNGKPGCSLPDLRRIAAIRWRSQRSELYGNRCPTA